jgi:hypothetical protein
MILTYIPYFECINICLQNHPAVSVSVNLRVSSLLIVEPEETAAAT